MSARETEPLTWKRAGMAALILLMLPLVLVGFVAATVFDCIELGWCVGRQTMLDFAKAMRRDAARGDG